MTAKTSQARRAAFFAALRETGNQTLACERAKVSRAWVQLQRSTDPQFKADVGAAVEEAKEKLRWAHCQGANLPRRSAAMSGGHGDPDNRARGDVTCRPPREWRFQDGEELVVRGSRGRRVQVARARLHQWTPRVEARFLALLARTCNVRLSLREVGLSAQALHEHRKRWPDFDARCEDALDEGYWRLDGGVVTAGLLGLNPRLAERYALSPPMVAPMSADDAIRLLRLHERRRWEAARGIGPGGRVWRWRRNRDGAGKAEAGARDDPAWDDPAWDDPDGAWDC
jgi:hypothetical protein